MILYHIYPISTTILDKFLQKLHFYYDKTSKMFKTIVKFINLKIILDILKVMSLLQNKFLAKLIVQNTTSFAGLLSVFMVLFVSQGGDTNGKIHIRRDYVWRQVQH